jgi:tRNA pseudouridine13 synthase
MSLTVNLTYLTADLPGIGGVIKRRPDDFLVEEIPLYEPCGEGEHTYLFIEKNGLTTDDVVRRIAHEFHVRRSDVGYAGLKDKHAVTRQHFSVCLPRPGEQDTALRHLSHHPHIKVLWVDRHTNKLRLGHLRGNRFVIRVREVEPTSVIRAKAVLDRLTAAGVPDFFGEQRFGYRQNGHLLGRMLLLGDYEGFVRETLGDPREADSPPLREARERFVRGDIDGALEVWPRKLRHDRQLLDYLRQGRSAEAAVRALDFSQRDLLLTAMQSAVFNAVLDVRLRDGSFARLLPGDLAWKHDNGAVFAVDEATAAIENSRGGRVPRLEVSPSGPMWGADMTPPAGEPLRIEREALASLGIAEEDFAAAGRHAPPGKRRPLRVPVTNADISGGVDEHGGYVRLAFDLPRGAFATIVLREVMKADTSPDLPDTPHAT